jgi:type IV pilus assembly protein PilB
MSIAIGSPFTLENRLLQMGVINENQLDLARREQGRHGGLLRRALVDLGFVSPETVSKVVAAEARVGVVDLNKVTVDKSVTDLVSRDLCRRYRAVPISRSGNALTLAMADPLDIVAVDAFRQITGFEIDVVTAPERDILNFLDQFEPSNDSIQDSIDRVIKEKDDDRMPEQVRADDIITTVGEAAPVIHLVSKIISRAVAADASDIHFEPEEKHMRIRIRVDGVLRPNVLVPKALQSAVIARVKILAGMDVTEDRVPQDGRASIMVERRQTNLRISSLPTRFGESVVIRILDAGTEISSLASLDMEPGVERQLRQAIDSPYGVVMVTGPTGSGKTTTLNTVLGEINSAEYSIFTLEDPIELTRPGLRQTQIKEDIGLTFANGLRSLLRQDPDIIMVGETRDTETAQLLVRAALTGHLVFSTLHTNDAASAIPRLSDMGVEPYLLPGALVAVLAQRLVRRLCEKCKVPVKDAAAEFAKQGVTPPAGQPLQLWNPRGCPHCSGEGFRGRQGIFELMMISESFHQPIVNRAGTPELFEIARAAGMKTMFEDGIRRSLAGTTTLSELLRVTRA